VSWHPCLDDIEDQADVASRAPEAWRDNRDPATLCSPLGSMGYCWCGERLGHDWDGKRAGAPHPRTASPASAAGRPGQRQALPAGTTGGPQ
jgi:hypothetical protein